MNLIDMSPLMVDFRLSKVNNFDLLDCLFPKLEISINCNVSSTNSLNFIANVFSQGDGLDFKRHFLKIKAQLKDIIDR